MRFISVASVGATGFLASCAAPPPAPPAPPPPSMMSLYEASIREAAVKQPADLEARLEPITGKTVDVATWSFDLNSHSIGKGVRTLGEDVWITLVPDLKRHCEGLTGDALPLRFQQLLGIPPGNATDRKTFTFTVPTPTSSP